ncbi:MAG: hypothetical protein Q9162_003003 [Coniocarpon cinnabarinum]
MLPVVATSEGSASTTNRPPQPHPIDTQATSHEIDNTDNIERPPVSPITPTASHVDPAEAASIDTKFPYALPADNGRFMQRPESLPIDEDQNFDAIALKSSLATLELQKQKARQDMLKLRDIRDGGLQSPERFKDDLVSGRLTYEARPQNALQATLEGGNDSSDEGDDDGDTHAGKREHASMKIPGPQNIVRCPPINWEKYHIIGEPLDRMHEDQRIRPTPGQPWSEEREAVASGSYEPSRDKSAPISQTKPAHLPPPMETRRSHNRKKSGG